jgi:hypothetical protein
MTAPHGVSRGTSTCRCGNPRRPGQRECTACHRRYEAQRREEQKRSLVRRTFRVDLCDPNTGKRKPVTEETTSRARAEGWLKPGREDRLVQIEIHERVVRPRRKVR